MFNDIEYLLVININFTLIDRIMIFTVCENIYDGIFYVVLGALKVVIFTVLLIIMLIKPKKGLYALEFIILFVDMLCLVGLSNNYIIEHLNTNRPVIVCVWNKPNDNRWTTASHYMVLLASDGNNMVYVSNPNGLENDSKSSGWYDINEVTSYLAKAIFIESYE